MREPPQDDRGAIQLVDVFMSFYMLVGLVSLIPLWYKFTDMAANASSPLVALLLQLFVPLILIALIVSVGISARTAGGR